MDIIQALQQEVRTQAEEIRLLKDKLYSRRSLKMNSVIRENMRLFKENAELRFNPPLDFMKTDNLTRRCKLLEKALTKAQDNFKELKRSLKVSDKDREYVAYLQLSLSKMERLHEEDQCKLEQYQKHFAKYGHFYNDLDVHRDEGKAGSQVV